MIVYGILEKYVPDVLFAKVMQLNVNATNMTSRFLFCAQRERFGIAIFDSKISAYT